MNAPLQRPGPDDVAPDYRAYIDLVPRGDVLGILEAGVAETRRALRGVPADRETYRYAPGKWSVRDVVGHVLDGERVFGNRAFHMARGDPAPLPSMDQEIYASTAGADRRPLADLLVELDLVRQANVRMFRSFDADAWERTGTASSRPFRVRSFPFILAGHEIHHRRVLAERYLAIGPAGP